MIQATEIYYIVFGIVTFLGGIIGYAKVKSTPSLVIGLVFGITLVGAGILLLCGQTNAVKIGLILGLLGTAGLSGLFIPKVMMNRAAPHVIAMAVLSGIGLVLTLIAFAGK
ncbi:MAG: TMEM14 family protein [Chthoniobacteraceae bacterium]|nr:TMEM14 family protein [Chthoniobacteraceae bacterium]